MSPFLIRLMVAALGVLTLPLGASASPATFGSKIPGLFNLKGTVYFLEPGTHQMPDSLDRMKPQAVIYAERLDIPERDFTEGFPDVTDRFEWFGIVYACTLQVTSPGTYKWRIASDDGTRLWIDDQEIITNDGIHAETSAEGDLELPVGNHALRAWYFQGPAQSIALQLFITPPGGVEKIFSLADYSADLAQTIQRVHAESTDRGIRVRLDAGSLFGTAGSQLAPSAGDTMAAVARLIRSYPGLSVRIEGHTDATLDKAASQRLSLDWANAVKTALLAAGLPGTTRFETAGLGRQSPLASNRNARGRAQNRRIEIYIGS